MVDRVAGFSFRPPVRLLVWFASGLAKLQYCQDVGKYHDISHNFRDQRESIVIITLAMLILMLSLLWQFLLIASIRRIQRTFQDSNSFDLG